MGHNSTLKVAHEVKIVQEHTRRQRLIHSTDIGKSTVLHVRTTEALSEDVCLSVLY